MNKIIILQGIPASGKTTWAKKFVENNPDYVRVNRDDLRRMRGKYWIPQQEGIISEIEQASVEASMKAGFGVVLDSTNLNPKYHTIWEKLAEKYEYEVEYKVFKVGLKVALRRDARRENSVGARVIKEFYYKYQNQSEERLYLEQDVHLNPAIIVDIDGTLALRNNRTPFEYKKVGRDNVNQPVYNMVYNYAQAGEVILLSGREDSCRKETEAWLKQYEVPYTYLYMRKAGDYRQDAVIKREIFEDCIKGKYYIQYVLDDRDQVVDMWRELGLLTLQVWYGDF
jgi:predicted kinase